MKEQQTEVYQWARLISAGDWKLLEEMAMQDEYKQEVVGEMERINSDRTLRYQYITREIEQLDRNSMRKDYIDQGIKIGEERGEKRLFALMDRMTAAGEGDRFRLLKDDPEALKRKYEEYHL